MALNTVKVTIVSADGLQIWDRDGRYLPFAEVYVDPNNKLRTKVDDVRNRRPHWGQKLAIPVEKPIADTTLCIGVYDAGNNRNTERIGSAKLKLKKVVNEAGYGVRTKQTLNLKRFSGISRGKVDVEVLIKGPGTKKKLRETVKDASRVLVIGAAIAGVVGDVVEAVEGGIQG